MKSTPFEAVVQTEEEGIVWEGKVTSISSTNSQGPFDILALHANFITIVNAKDIVMRDGDSVIKTFHFPQAVIYIKDSKAQVYAIKAGK